MYGMSESQGKRKQRGQRAKIVTAQHMKQDQQGKRPLDAHSEPLLRSEPSKVRAGLPTGGSVQDQPGEMLCMRKWVL